MSRDPDKIKEDKVKDVRRIVGNERDCTDMDLRRLLHLHHWDVAAAVNDFYESFDEPEPMWMASRAHGRLNLSQPVEYIPSLNDPVNASGRDLPSSARPAAPITPPPVTGGQPAFDTKMSASTTTPAGPSTGASPSQPEETPPPSRGDSPPATGSVEHPVLAFAAVPVEDRVPDPTLPQDLDGPPIDQEPDGNTAAATAGTAKARGTEVVDDSDGLIIAMGRKRSLPVELTADDDLEMLVPALSARKIADAAGGHREGRWPLGEAQVTAYSTTTGSNLLEAGEKVKLQLPKPAMLGKKKGPGGNAGKGKARWQGKAAVPPSGPSSDMVWFENARGQTVGRIPAEWARCLRPLMQDAQSIEVHASCLCAPERLRVGDNVFLSLVVYALPPFFAGAGDVSQSSGTTPGSFSGEVPYYPPTALISMLGVRRVIKAEFSPEDFNQRKKSVDFLCSAKDSTRPSSAPSVLPAAKRSMAPSPLHGSSSASPLTLADGEDGEGATLSEKAVSELCGVLDGSDLEMLEPSPDLLCELRPYQKQALFFMARLEEGIHLDDARRTLHPCWESYQLYDKGHTVFYHNPFSGEVTFKYPSITQVARGGILADAMGLGKTVMATALIASKRGRGLGEDLERQQEEAAAEEGAGKPPPGKQARINGFARAAPSRPSRHGSGKGGGTLVVCPMSLLSQWKDELDTHVVDGALSVYTYYGSDRKASARPLWESDVVLTTYGVLATEGQLEALPPSSPLSIPWFRVILDEAHNIKARTTQNARACFRLVARNRWCLTGTPIQNKLEDIYSLLRFLGLEPWGNWSWFNKIIAAPHENGDMSSLRMLQAVLRPIMLRRTKDTHDRMGRPILVLPPAKMEVIELDFTEAERDFYSALYQRSKVKFDHFVAQGKVLNNYASILELLLRLRQCCDHPFLVLSRGDTAEFADLDKLARRFVRGNPDHQRHANKSSSHSHTHNGGSSSTNGARGRASGSASDDANDQGNGDANAGHPDADLPVAAPGPTEAFVAAVVDELRRGERSECPICLEVPEDAVLTPCAHAMCRECLLASWRSHVAGACPICRSPVSRQELVTVPTESRFRVDIENQWQDSSKVAALVRELLALRESHHAACERAASSRGRQEGSSGSGSGGDEDEDEDDGGEGGDRSSRPSPIKSVVFSQWTAFLDLLQVPLKRHGISFVRLDGTLSQAERERVLQRFKTDDSVTDPWWCPAVEEQAIMRVHRIGQRRDVFVKRFIVKDTVEDRMRLVQARKERMVNGALNACDADLKAARIEDLKTLFR
eukprot:jgi/Mesvir1/24718/Mv21990-RA.5